MNLLKNPKFLIKRHKKAIAFLTETDYNDSIKQKLEPVLFLRGGLSMSYKKSAEEILTAIGGEENIDAMAHCATRLRLVLKDESKVNEQVLSDMDVVKGTFSTGGQYQIIIG